MPPATSPTASVCPATCDVIVIGGGPAGSAVATLLARQGRDVVLVEKSRHPRFHIGESLLPASGPLLERLGVRDQVDRIAMPKWGVEFSSHAHQQHSFLEFADAWDKSLPSAWQVRRSEFDELLFRHAAASGARTVEDCQVDRVDFDDDTVRVQARDAAGQQRRWQARYVVDATGRDTLLARQFGALRKNTAHNSAALYGHYRGATRLPGKREGNISLFWFEHGWFWFIPLADGSTSVGAVCWPQYLKSRQSPLPEFFADTIALVPDLAQRLCCAELIDARVHATGNYSYSSTQACGERFLLLGDAYAFIDPVFSSGVHLALASAFEGAELVALSLDRPQQAAPARRRFDAHMRKGPREFSWFIYRMTNPVMREIFLHPRNVLRAQEAVLSVLAGDVFGRRPYRASLLFFKAVYYLGSLLSWRRVVAARRRRGFLIRDPEGSPAPPMENR